MRTPFRFLRFGFLLVAAALVAGCQAVFFRAVNAGRSDDAETFTFDPAHDLKLDVHRARNGADAAPIVLFFYGGSWRQGRRDEYAFVGKALARRGIAVVIPDYRKAPAYVFPAFEEDAAAAARWTFDHAAEIGGDRSRIFVAGHSAGAQIAALLATDARYLRAQHLSPRDFAGAIGIAGPYDFLPLTDPDLIEVFGNEAEWPASQPINFVDGDEPPFLLLQGTGDRIVDPRNATALADKLTQHGSQVSLKSYRGVGHFRILAAMRFESLGPTCSDIADFVAKTPPANAAEGTGDEQGVE